MYTYTKDDSEMWTGFMSSLPDFKRAVTGFTDFAEAVEQVSGLSAYKEEVDHMPSILRGQKVMMEIDNIMQHHDAVTGTHSMVVDEDYFTKMNEVQDFETDERVWGSFAKNVEQIAKDFGIEISQITKCDLLDGTQLSEHLSSHQARSKIRSGLELDTSARITKPSVAGHTLDCFDGMNMGSSQLVSVYNPNVEEINGLIFLLEREQAFASVKLIRGTASSDNDKKLETEILCQSEELAQVSGSDACLAYVDTKVDGLSFSFFQIELGQAPDDFEIIAPQVVFSSKDTNKTGMSDDVSIELPDGQFLSLRKIGNKFDPVVLTYSHSLT